MLVQSMKVFNLEPLKRDNIAFKNVHLCFILADMI